MKRIPARMVSPGAQERPAAASLLLPLSATLLLLCAGCAAPHGGRDSWFGRDKAYHFGVGAMVGGCAAAVAAHNGASDGGSMVAGVAVVMPIGAAKEAYDARVRKTGWSWKDLAWDLAGALTGGLVVMGVD